MAIIPTGSAILKMSVVLSPIIISILILLLSFLEGNLSGIVYLSGLILAQLIGFMTRPAFGKYGLRKEITAVINGDNYTKDPACSIFEAPYFDKYSCPSFNAIFFWFTLTYMFGSQISEGWTNFSFIKFIILLVFTVADVVFIVNIGECIDPTHYLWGTFFGVMLGGLWWYSVNGLDHTMLQNVTSNKNKCDIINSNMKCDVVEVSEKDPEGVVVDWSTVVMGGKIAAIEKALKEVKDATDKADFDKFDKDDDDFLDVSEVDGLVTELSGDYTDVEKKDLQMKANDADGEDDKISFSEYQDLLSKLK